MVKNHSDTRGDFMGLSFRLAANDLLYPKDRILHITAFVKPTVEHYMQREIAQWCLKQYCIQVC